MKKIPRYSSVRTTALPFLCLFLLVQLTAHGQRLPKMEALNRVIFTRLDTTYRFYTLRPTTEKADVSATYHWFKPDTILVTKGGFDGKLLDGVYEVFYPNKNLAEKGQFVKGLKSGEWRSWYPDGHLKGVLRWSKGKRQGKFEAYDKQGAKVQAGIYDDDQLSGQLITYAADTVASRQTYRHGEPVLPTVKKKSRKKSDAADDPQQ